MPEEENYYLVQGVLRLAIWLSFIILCGLTFGYQPTAAAGNPYECSGMYFDTTLSLLIITLLEGVWAALTGFKHFAWVSPLVAIVTMSTAIGTYLSWQDVCSAAWIAAGNSVSKTTSFLNLACMTLGFGVFLIVIRIVVLFIEQGMCDKRAPAPRRNVTAPRSAGSQATTQETPWYAVQRPTIPNQDSVSVPRYAVQRPTIPNQDLVLVPRSYLVEMQEELKKNRESIANPNSR